jgi:hypothetical protein
MSMANRDKRGGGGNVHKDAAQKKHEHGKGESLITKAKEFLGLDGQK